jgi:hypothetical protein
MIFLNWVFQLTLGIPLGGCLGKTTPPLNHEKIIVKVIIKKFENFDKKINKCARAGQHASPSSRCLYNKVIYRGGFCVSCHVTGGGHSGLTLGHQIFSNFFFINEICFRDVYLSIKAYIFKKF